MATVTTTAPQQALYPPTTSTTSQQVISPPTYAAPVIVTSGIRPSPTTIVQAAPPPRPANYLTLAIITTILCNILFGKFDIRHVKCPSIRPSILPNINPTYPFCSATHIFIYSFIQRSKQYFYALYVFLLADNCKRERERERERGRERESVVVNIIYFPKVDCTRLQ